MLPPSAAIAAAAIERLTNIATAVPGSSDGLRDAAVWVAATQGHIPPRQLVNVRLVVLASDYGALSISTPRIATELRAALDETLGLNSQAIAHGVSVRILDVGVDDDFTELPQSTRLALQAFKIRRSTAPIDVGNTLSDGEARAALAAGAAVAREEIAKGAQLLIIGDLGETASISAAALVAALLGLPANAVVAQGDRPDGEVSAQQIVTLLEGVLARLSQCPADPLSTLAAVGSIGLVASVGLLIQAARSGIPVLVEGVDGAAAALAADRVAEGASAWFAAGLEATDPAQQSALAAIGVKPIVGVHLPFGRGARTTAGLPLFRSAAALLIQTTLPGDLGSASYEI